MSAQTKRKGKGVQEPSVTGDVHIKESCVNLLAVREHSQKELARLLDQTEGQKALVLDASLSGSLGMVTDVSLLKEHNVEFIYYLLPGELHTEAKKVVYFVRPSPECMDLIADQIHAHSQAGVHKEYTIMFVPRMTYLCEKTLVTRGVLGEVTLLEYHMDLVPVDEDLFTLPLEHDNTKHLFLEGDQSSLTDVARTIMKLQMAFGFIPNLRGKGDMAAELIAMLQRMKREVGHDASLNSAIPEIDSLLVIDRSVDWVTPLMHQLTYEGLLDETFHIDYSFIEVSKEVLGKGVKESTAKKRKKKLVLNSSDPLFKEMRDSNFKVLGTRLKQKAVYLADALDERHSAKSVHQIHSFMKKFKQLELQRSLLQIHVNLAEQLAETTKLTSFKRLIDHEYNLLANAGYGDEADSYIESLIARGESLSHVLRLLCLMSHTHGIKSKRYDFLKRELLHTYGYQLFPSIENLERCGLLKRNVSSLVGDVLSHKTATSAMPFKQLSKVLHLMEDPANLDMTNPRASAPLDLNYTFEGYSPLSVRLLELDAAGGWHSKQGQELLAHIPGATTNVTQATTVRRKENSGHSSAKPVTLVFFLGGVTFSEISAIRLLAQRQDASRRFLVGSTHIARGENMVKSFLAKYDSQLDRRSLNVMGDVRR